MVARSVHPAVCDLVSVTKQFFFVEFHEIWYGNSVQKSDGGKCKIRENPSRDNHTSRKGVNEFLLVLSLFIDRSGWYSIYETPSLPFSSCQLTETLCSESHIFRDASIKFFLSFLRFSSALVKKSVLHLFAKLCCVFYKFIENRQSSSYILPCA